MARLPYQTLLCNHQHDSPTPACIVSKLAPCAPTAAPICYFAHAEERHLLSTCAQPVLFCTARTHERTYANPSAHDSNPCALLSMTRPALTAGPPSQRPFLSGLANCYAPCRPRSAHQSSHQTQTSDPRALTTKVKSLLRTSNRPSPPFCLARFRDEAEPGGSSFCHQTDTAT